MKIHEFNIDKGIYKFELDAIETNTHAHPAFEILYSRIGGIELELENYKYQNVSLAIIEPNKAHKIRYQKGNVLVLMLECNTLQLQQLLSKFEISLLEGLYVAYQTEDRTTFIEAIVNAINTNRVSITKDERIQNCLDYLNSTSADYTTIIEDLKLISHLSDSRLSHLFKQEIGLSIKKYFVWSKLKKAFKQVLGGQRNMYKAAIENGFYDQAHLSKAFKQMLGLSPSEVYNSRTLQV